MTGGGGNNDVLSSERDKHSAGTASVSVEHMEVLERDTHVYTHTPMHTDAHTQTQAHAQARMHARTHARTHARMLYLGLGSPVYSQSGHSGHGKHTTKHITSRQQLSPLTSSLQCVGPLEAGDPEM